MKKYELTSNTKTIYGITLYQIKALTDIPSIGVKAGDLGGYIEKEDNLSQLGTCWMSGDARVFGDAWVYDSAQVYGLCTRTPLHISGLQWPVTITDNLMTIGCQTHSHTAWLEFTDDTIIGMAGWDALRFWRENGEFLKSKLCKES